MDALGPLDFVSATLTVRKAKSGIRKQHLINNSGLLSNARLISYACT